LLRRLQPAIPRGWTVLVLADRGLYAPWLLRRLTQTPPRHPFSQWELKPTGYRRGKSPLGLPHFLPYNPLMYYIM